MANAGIINVDWEIYLTAVLHPAEEGGYWVSIRNVPGVLSQGETIEENMANIQEAFECTYGGGEPIPWEPEEIPAEQQIEFTARVSL